MNYSPEKVFPDSHERLEMLYHLSQLAENGHKVILLGDYVDSFDAKGKGVQYLLDIIQLIEQYRLPALIGNHDAHYFYKNMPICDGYQTKLAGALKMIFDQNKKLFKIIHVDEEKKVIYSHAGLGKDFLNALWELYKIDDLFEIEDFCNTFPKEVFWSSAKQHGGWDKIDGPLWLRPWQYTEPVFPEYTQIVGHTFNEIPVKEKNLIVCDTESIWDVNDLLKI